ncbi:hypothetical protein [Actinomadura kijaniata]|uniref:hypothetical protein n=1 Tax=Actinomadura kijaniata TaxID=46161 RepID=UPI00082A7C65|nr:hypothetical protein [Actinomadura kijaniata]
MAEMTLRALTARLVELGLVTPQEAEIRVAAADYADIEQSAVHLVGELVEYGLGVHTDHGDVDSLQEEYEDILTEAAACSGLTVSDVELVESAETADQEAGGTHEVDLLRFRLNGEPRAWEVERLSDEYIDHMALVSHLSDLEPGGDDQRCFHPVGEPEEVPFMYLLATPEHARILRDEFGFPVDVEEVPAEQPTPPGAER